MSKKVIELIRVSTENQAGEDRASIPAQQAVNRKTAQAYGLQIVKSIEITDVSGAAVLYAPEMQQLIRLIQSPEIHGVVAREFSRLMRPENFNDYVLLQAFVDTKTVLHLPEGPIDLSSKTGRLMGTIRAAIAGLERSEILERVWSAKEEKRRRGECPAAPMCLPFGVGYTKERGWFYKPEAEKMRECFRLFLGGTTSYKTLAKRMGFKSRTALKALMQNPIWTGWRVYDWKRDTSSAARRMKADGRQGGRRKVRRSAEGVIRVQVIKEPLISDADFKRVQMLIESKTERHLREREGYGHKFLYNGFLSCAQCGAPIYTFTRSRDGVGYYVCKNRMRRGAAKACRTSYMNQHQLEAKLNDLFSVQLTDKRILTNLIKQHEEQHNGRGQRARIARLQHQVETLREKRQRVLELFVEGLITRDERAKRLEDIDRETKLAQEVLLREEPQLLNLTAEKLGEIARPFLTWKMLDREGKRRVLASAMPEIRVTDYAIKGFYLLPPNGNGNGRASVAPLSQAGYLSLGEVGLSSRAG